MLAMGRVVENVTSEQRDCLRMVLTYDVWLKIRRFSLHTNLLHLAHGISDTFGSTVKPVNNGHPDRTELVCST